MSENAPEISACEAMTVAMVANTARGTTAHDGCHPEERVAHLVARASRQQGGLAEVVEQQGGEHQAVPGELDRSATEVAHVGVEGLAARHHQEDRAQREERLGRLVDEERDAIRG